VVSGSAVILGQVRKQLERIVDVVKVLDITTKDVT
jgi:acetolactate synthase small subunit